MKTRRCWPVVVILFVSVLLIARCLTLRLHQPGRLVTPLPKLTAAIAAIVRWPTNNEASLTNEELVAEVLMRKPELKRVFAGSPLKIWHDNKEVIVLVCSPDGKTAWLEDASWTPEVDCVWYQTNPSQPAEFSIKIPVRTLTEQLHTP